MKQSISLLVWENLDDRADLLGAFSDEQEALQVAEAIGNEGEAHHELNVITVKVDDNDSLLEAVKLNRYIAVIRDDDVEVRNTHKFRECYRGNIWNYGGEQPSVLAYVLANDEEEAAGIAMIRADVIRKRGGFVMSFPHGATVYL